METAWREHYQFARLSACFCVSICKHHFFQINNESSLFSKKHFIVHSWIIFLFEPYTLLKRFFLNSNYFSNFFFQKTDEVFA